MLIIFSLFLFSFLYSSSTVFIKGGEFIIPHGDTFYTAFQKSRKIKVKSFYIDKFEVTNKEFSSKFKKHSYEEDEAEYPVTKISYKQALNFCKSRGGDLPTEEEWIVAAAFERGKFYKFPTRNYPLKENDVNVKRGVALDIEGGYGAFNDKIDVNLTLKGINNLYGMLGSVWEIVKSKGDYVLIKGGSFFDYDNKSLYDVRVKDFILKSKLRKFDTVGFRCVYRSKN